MKVVALISGGKDSCYVMLRCRAHGHEIVALAHIAPPHGTREPDSHMYQAVGTAAVPAMAEALRLPLYVRETRAVAAVRELHYAPRDGDEVEDLVALLWEVRAAHPDVQGVCTGALWSDYQRLRVESAVSRTGLLSLSYLWRRDQRELLDEMIAAGVHAVLIKVAGIGLGPEHLGKSLAEVRDHLLNLHELYGSHVCGEGGEYETLVLSLPTFAHDLAWHDEDVSVVVHSDDAVAPVAFLDIRHVHPIDKHLSSMSKRLDGCIPLAPPVPDALRPVDVSCMRVDDYLHVIAKSQSAGAAGVTAAILAIRKAIQTSGNDTISGSQDPLREILYVWLRLASLAADDYASANAAYSAEFGTEACTPPPVRACVGMRGTGAAVVMETLVRFGRREDRETFTLHVQSLSEWAPPCIGPYAQAVCDADLLHICGVLALHAPTASIPQKLGARAQTRAALHNMRRTLEATPGSFETVGLFVAYVVAEALAEAVEEEIDDAYTSLYHHSFGGALAIVPVEALPKQALVEIRAVAAVDGAVPGGFVSGFGRSVRMQRLTYSVVELHRIADLPSMASSIISSLPVKNVLSASVFIRRDAFRSWPVNETPVVGNAECGAKLQSLLEAEGFSAATLIANVEWLAHGADVLCIATAVQEL
jgi:diphthine-ammonia ligase